MTPVLEDGVCRAIGAAKAAQAGKYLHFLVGEINGRLRPTLATGSPFMVDLPPVLWSNLAPPLVAELLLILCEQQAC